MGGELGSNSGHGQVTHTPTVTLGHSVCNNLEFDEDSTPCSSTEMFYVTKEYGA